MTKLIDNEVNFGETTDHLIIEKSQYIPDEFLKELRQERDESKHRRSGEYMRVASIPTAVVENWISRGIPFWDMSAKQIVAQLHTDGLDAFLTTDKQV